ncbi:uncharacterized protein LOC126812349 [Patella vulgata]|uniref:uncharacterized protein LOC126812349 n=1 Tax=Patella vulgata TaxID=6465 RepID=UPI0021807901|nr:uncharacterized protein LOC126812349 [Patella vulgata]
MASINTTIASISTTTSTATTGTTINNATQLNTGTSNSSSLLTTASTTTSTLTASSTAGSTSTPTPNDNEGMIIGVVSSITVLVILAVIVMFILWRKRKQNKRKNKAVGKLPDINAIQTARNFNETASVGQIDPVIEIEDTISTSSSTKSNYYDANKFPVKLKNGDSSECVKRKEPVKQTESVPYHEAPPIPCDQSKIGYVNLPIVNIINDNKQTPEYKNLNGTESSIYVNNEMIIQEKTDSNSNYYENTDNSPLYYNQEEDNQGFEIGEDYENAPKKNIKPSSPPKPSTPPKSSNPRLETPPKTPPKPPKCELFK